jgi:hypothetical protein
VGARNIRSFLAMVAAIFASQVVYLRLVYCFCQRMLAPMWGVSPDTVWGWRAFWKSLDLYPGVVVPAVVQVSVSIHFL